MAKRTRRELDLENALVMQGVGALCRQHFIEKAREIYNAIGHDMDAEDEDGVVDAIRDRMLDELESAGLRRAWSDLDYTQKIAICRTVL